MLFRRAWVAVAFLVALGQDRRGGRRPRGRARTDPAPSASDARSLDRPDRRRAGRPVGRGQDQARPRSPTTASSSAASASTWSARSRPPPRPATSSTTRARTSGRRWSNGLLDSPAYTTRATELWRQLLLPEAETEDQARVVAGSFEAWLRRKVVEEAGYDRIVREILTAKLSGRNTDGDGRSGLDPSPAAYYVAKEGKPENLAAGAARVFLGVRLECAQCHDHPFARWKRERFLGLRRLLRGRPAAGSRSRGRGPDAPRGRRAPRADDPGDEEGRQGRPPRRLQAGLAAPRRHAARSWPTGSPRPRTRTSPGPPSTASGPASSASAWSSRSTTSTPRPTRSSPRCSTSWPGSSALHGYDLKYLIRVLTATRAYNLSSAAGPGRVDDRRCSPRCPSGASRPASSSTASAQATGADVGGGPGPLPRPVRQPRRAADRGPDVDPPGPDADERDVTSPAPPAWRPATCSGRSPRPRSSTPPGRIETLYLADPDPPAEARGAALLVRYVERRESPERPRQGARRRLLGPPERPRVPPQSLIDRWHGPAGMSPSTDRPFRDSNRRSSGLDEGDAAMNRPNRQVPQLTRRQVLRLAAAGALGASASGWIEALAADTAARPEPAEVVHPALDDRRPEPDRHLRPQAGPRQRRPVQADRDDACPASSSASTCRSSPGRRRTSPSSAR